MRADSQVSAALQAVDTLTHKWHLYVRGPAGEDLSPIIKKVHCLDRVRLTGAFHWSLEQEVNLPHA
jgi:hypothetical protein